MEIQVEVVAADLNVFLSMSDGEGFAPGFAARLGEVRPHISRPDLKVAPLVLEIESQSAAKYAAEWLYRKLSKKQVEVRIQDKVVNIQENEIEKVLLKEFAEKTRPKILSDDLRELHERLDKQISDYDREYRWSIRLILIPTLLGALIAFLCIRFGISIEFTLTPSQPTIVAWLALVCLFLMMIRGVQRAGRVDRKYRKPTPEERMFLKVYAILRNLGDSNDREAPRRATDGLEEIVKWMEGSREWTLTDLGLTRRVVVDPVRELREGLSHHIPSLFVGSDEPKTAKGVEILQDLAFYLSDPSLEKLIKINDVALKLPPSGARPRTLFDHLKERRLLADLFAVLVTLSVTLSAFLVGTYVWQFPWSVQFLALLVAIFIGMLAIYFSSLRPKRQILALGEGPQRPAFKKDVQN